MAVYSSGRGKRVVVEVLPLRGSRPHETQDEVGLQVGPSGPDLQPRADTTSPRRVKHAWEPATPGKLTLKRQFVCPRCGTVVEVPYGALPDGAARKLGIPDDCDEAVAYNIHVA